MMEKSEEFTIDYLLRLNSEERSKEIAKNTTPIEEVATRWIVGLYRTATSAKLKYLDEKDQQFLDEVISDLRLVWDLVFINGRGKKQFKSLYGKKQNLAAAVCYYSFYIFDRLDTFFDKKNEVYEFQKFKKELAKSAANALHSERQTDYANAYNFVKLDLDGNCNPEWTHADYLNYILNDPRYRRLSPDTLRDGIRAIFRERILTDRIAKGAARHVKRNK